MHARAGECIQADRFPSNGAEQNLSADTKVSSIPSS